MFLKLNPLPQPLQGGLVFSTLTFSLRDSKLQRTHCFLLGHLQRWLLLSLPLFLLFPHNPCFRWLLSVPPGVLLSVWESIISSQFGNQHVKDRARCCVGGALESDSSPAVEFKALCGKQVVKHHAMKSRQKWCCTQADRKVIS